MRKNTIWQQFWKRKRRKHSWMERKSNTYKNLINRKSKQKSATTSHVAWLATESLHRWKKITSMSFFAANLSQTRRERITMSSRWFKRNSFPSVSCNIKGTGVPVLYVKQYTKLTFLFHLFSQAGYIKQYLNLTGLSEGKNLFSLINTGNPQRREAHFSPTTEVECLTMTNIVRAMWVIICMHMLLSVFTCISQSDCDK